MAAQRVLAGSSEDQCEALRIRKQHKGQDKGRCEGDHIAVLTQSVLVISSGNQRSGPRMISPLVFLTE